jgi:hypothetical protein
MDDYYWKFYGEVVYELEGLIGVDTSDAQGLVDSQESLLRRSLSKGLSVRDAAKLIDKASRVD